MHNFIINSAWAQDLPSPTIIDKSTITGWITSIADFFIFAGIMLAIIVIVWSGIRWMMAGGNDTEVTKAKATLKAGIIGAVVVLGVGLIIDTIVSLVDQSFFD